MAKPSLGPLLPIAKAPTKPNEIYGPCLVSPGVNGSDWALSEWDGSDWFTLDGECRLKPCFYIPLPPISSLTE